jgi:hypothetical protein
MTSVSSQIKTTGHASPSVSKSKMGRHRGHPSRPFSIRKRVAFQIPIANPRRFSDTPRVPPAIRHFLLLVATLLAQITMAHTAEIPLIFDIQNDHIEATLTMPASETPSTHADLSTYLQTHLSFTTPDGQPMTFELIGSGQTATLYIYPPNDTTPPAFTISTTALNHRLQLLLRRDPVEMRLGVDPLLPLGTLDSFKNSLTIEREFPPLTSRATAAFTTALQLLLTQATPFLLLLLLSTSLANPTKTASAFTHAGLAILTFAAGTSTAVILETHLPPALLNSLFIATSAALLFLIWKPSGPVLRLITTLAAGWITGVSWNNAWFPQGSFEKEILLTLSAATLPALIAITLLALPALLLLARQLPPFIFRGSATICGIIVILLLLTALARPA